MPKKLTQQQFMDKLPQKVKDTLGLSKYVYCGNTGKSTVVCPVHGEYQAAASTLLQGCTCAKCFRASQIGDYGVSKEEFIRRYKASGRTGLDFTNSVWKGTNKKLIAVCYLHGEVPINPNSLMSRGSGCGKCGDIKTGLAGRNTPEKFLRQCREVHGDRYDYSKAVYVTSKNPVEIVCREHGSFFPVPGNFIGRRSGCPECGKISVGLQSRKSLTHYVSKFREVHGDRFEYKGLSYEGNYSTVIVTCPVHGEFTQRVADHQNGIGCSRCSLPVHDTKSFILEATRVHGGYYDYSKAEYKKAVDKVEIICPEHGPFWQIPTHHVHTGNGCRLCANRGFDPDKPATFYVYKVDSSLGEFVGFGITGNIQVRHEKHCESFTEAGATGTLLHTYDFVEGQHAKDLERYIIKNLPISSSGVDGFKSEALVWEMYGGLVDIAQRFHELMGNAELGV